MWLFWHIDLSLTFSEHVEQFVHTRVTFRSGASFLLSKVYAKCTRIGRRLLWSGMELLGWDVQLPWISVGDFNIFTSAKEMVGGLPINAINMEEFNSSMFRCGFSFVDFDDHPFTWTNGTVWQRLDRALVNLEWLNGY